MITATLIIAVILLVVNILVFIKLNSKDDKEIKELILNENSRIKGEISTTLNSNLQTFSQTLSKHISTLTDINMKRLSEINETLQRELKYLIEKNEKKLEDMRLIVDEKLHITLEKRLSEAFKVVSQQLENVYKGIGDMQRLASEVGNLKEVLSNVKQRGRLGEIQLKNILEDMIPPNYFVEQYSFDDGKKVDFVVKIPSKTQDNYILLPIDAKFPVEDYQRLLSAKESMDKEAIKRAQKQFENNILKKAQEIAQYIMPPKTTDFAIMFVPSEGIFAEILSIEDLFEKVRKDFRIIITGPTTITAILASLQIGFKTLAIEKKSHEVWKLLEGFRKEFLEFSETLEKARKKLKEATAELEEAHEKTAEIEKSLKGVEKLDFYQKNPQTN